MSKGYLIDTNIISELCKTRQKIDPGVHQWVKSTADQQLFTSVLVIGELQQGLLRLRRRDPIQADLLQAKLDQLGFYLHNTLPVDINIVECWAKLSVPDPLPVIDGLLAATALTHDLAVVTRNIRDFAKTAVVCINPFSAP